MGQNTYVQRGHRFILDDGALGSATLTGQQNGNLSITVGTANRIRIRFILQETANAKTETIYPNLYYSINSGTWTAANGSTDPVKLITSFNTSWTATDGDVVGTQRLTFDGGLTTWQDGFYCDDNDGAHGLGLRYQYTEIEFCIYLDGTYCDNNDSIQIRMHDGASVFNTYDYTPTITVVEAATNALTASDITSGTPTVATATIGQTHALSASEITSGTPTLDDATIAQIHALTASDVTSGVPTLDSPTLSETSILDSADVTSGTPTFGAPTLGVVHNLSSLDVTSGVPTLGPPTMYANVTYGVDETNWFFSPTNWYKSGTTYAITNSPGAYMKLAFTGTGLSMTINLSLFQATGPNASDFPYFKWRTDGGSWQKQITTNGQTTFTFETGLSNTSHTIEIYFESIQRNRDRWLNPSASIRVDNVTVENGGGLTAPTLASERWLIFGDSRTEGVNTYGDTYANADQGGARTWAIQIGETQGAEVGAIGWVSQGFTWPPPANSNVPRFNDTVTAEYSWTEFMNGISRSFTGIDTIIVNEGVNDGGGVDTAQLINDIVDFLTDIRTAAPSARIILLVPFGDEDYYNRQFAHDWGTAIQQYIDGSSDTNVFVTSITGLNATLDYDLSWQTPTTYSIDGGHPNQAGHDEIATLLDGVLGGDIMMAHDITSGTPTLDTPTLAQITPLTANDVTSGVPTMDAPTLAVVGETWAEVSWIEFQMPALAGVHPLVASDVTSGTPTTDTPTISQVHSLTASEVTSGVPTLDAPTLQQVNALTASDVTSGIPTLDSPSIAQVHALTASDVTSGVPALDSPTLSAISHLTANDVTSGVPTLDTPSIGQVHPLTANDVTSGVPTYDAPTIGQVHALTATEITSGVPTVDSPTIGQVHALTSSDVTSGVPTLDSPTLTQTHALTATEITSGVPTLDTPSLSHIHNLNAADVVSGAPTIDSPSIGQTHSLTANDVTSGVPTYDAPTIGTFGEDALTANDVSTTATLDSPTLGQTHDLTASDVTSGVPTYDAPTIQQIVALTANDVTSGVPTYDAPSISQAHALTASDITSGVPTVDSPTIGQVHALTASDVTSGAWTRDLPTLEEPRFLRPDTDISTGTWQSTEATFHDAVNETVVDNDTYIFSDPDPTASAVELGLSNASDPESTSFHIIHYVSHKDGTGTANVTYYLMQGAVQIATWTDNDISETPTMRSYELSVAEINSITDYNDLRIIAEATVT